MFCVYGSQLVLNWDNISIGSFVADWNDSNYDIYQFFRSAWILKYEYQNCITDLELNVTRHLLDITDW